MTNASGKGSMIQAATLCQQIPTIAEQGIHKQSQTDSQKTQLFEWIPPGDAMLFTSPRKKVENGCNRSPKSSAHI